MLFQPKKLKSSAQSSAHPAPTPIQTQVQNAQKKASRKSKLGKGKRGKIEGPILGGADYVTLMLGGRRKAEEEAKKLPRDD